MIADDMNKLYEANRQKQLDEIVKENKLLEAQYIKVIEFIESIAIKGKGCCSFEELLCICDNSGFLRVRLKKDGFNILKKEYDTFVSWE